MEESAYRLLAIIVQALGFAGAIISLWFVREQIHLNTRSTELAAFNSSASAMLELGKLFVDKHHLRKYFYEAKQVPTDPGEYAEAEAVAIVLLDFMATVLVYVRQYPHLYPEQEWHNWIKDMFYCSPILRDVYNHLLETGRQWYVDDLSKLMQEAMTKRQLHSIE